MYWPLPGEADLRPLMALAWSLGKEVYLPRIPSSPPPASSFPRKRESRKDEPKLNWWGVFPSFPHRRESRESAPQMNWRGEDWRGEDGRTNMDFVLLRPGALPLRPRALPPPQPIPAAPGWPVARPPAQLDLILAPLVAFDRAGGRLGMGGGYYDRLLSAPRPPVIGVAHGCQEVPRVPLDAWDQPVDAIVTETALIAPPSRGLPLAIRNPIRYPSVHSTAGMPNPR